MATIKGVGALARGVIARWTSFETCGEGGDDEVARWAIFSAISLRRLLVCSIKVPVKFG